MDHVARTHNESDRKRYREMSENNWTFQQLLEKNPSLNHSKQRVFNNSYVVQFANKPARTIIAHLYKDGNQFIHPDFRQERTITPREAARLQSFPDNFVFEGSRTQQYKQIGNAVPPLMANAIAKKMKEILEFVNKHNFLKMGDFKFSPLMEICSGISLDIFGVCLDISICACLNMPICLDANS